MTRSLTVPQRFLRRRWLGGWCALWLATAGTAWGAEPLTRFNVVLLQPSAVLEARVPDVDAMAAYIRAVEAAARDAVVASSVKQAVGGFIVVAVRPGPQSKVWLDFDALLDLGLKQRLIRQVQAVPAMPVQQGPVVFALKVATWDGKESRRQAPLPAEWKRATPDQAPEEVGALVERIWSDD